MKKPETAAQVAKFNRLLDNIIELFEHEIQSEHGKYIQDGQFDETALATDLFNFTMQFFTKQMDEWQPIVRSALQKRWRSFVESHGREMKHESN